MPDSASNRTRRLRAVLYSRLSRETLVSTSLRGQADDLAALAERENWEVVAHFVDEGLSGGKRRAAADEAVRMLESGAADVLAAYSVDRFSRMGIGEDAVLVRIVRRAAKAKSQPPRVMFIREGIDSAADSQGWALRFVIASEMAFGEREVMVARRKAGVARLQHEGRYSGRGPAPWGYRSAAFDDGRPGRRLVVDPKEAAVIREVAERIVDGDSTVSIARDLNAARVPLPRSDHRLAILRGEDPVGNDGKPLDAGRWTSSRVSQMWASRHLVGWVMRGTTRKRDEAEHEGGGRGSLQREGDPVLDVSGLPLQAFEPILDLTTSDLIRTRFGGNPGKGKQQKRKASRLLSGLLYCTCDAPMYAVTTTYRGQKYAYYRCSSRSRGGTCPGVSIKADSADDIVAAHYVKSFGRLPAVAMVERREGAADAERLALIGERIEASARAMTKQGADRRALVEEIDRLDAMRAVLLAVEPRVTTESVDLGRPWSELFAEGGVIERRRLLGLAWDHIVVRRPGDGERLVYIPADQSEGDYNS